MSKTEYSCADCHRPMAQGENGCIDMTDHAEGCAGAARFVVTVHEEPVPA